MRTIKEIRRLLSDTSYRAEMQSCIAEGKKIVADFLRHPQSVAYCVIDSGRYSSDDQLKDILKRVYEQEIPVSFVESKTLMRMSTLKTNQGILAEIRIPRHDLALVLKNEQLLLVVGDAIQDPSNVGVLVRNALAFNSQAVIFTSGSADVYAPKGLRAASGSVLDIPIFYMTCDDLMELKKKSVYFMAASLDGARAIKSITSIPSHTAVVFGNEGSGVNQFLIRRSDTTFYIPINERINSLNITSAAAVALYHIESLRYTAPPQ
ncbi:MAG: RNA methyltransferase [bacterium]|nr:RNA methyltransferase [bacterium]